MERRFVSIWFPYLTTDWFTVRKPELCKVPFVLRAPSHGRMVITSANAKALSNGIVKDMVLADARALIPDLEVQDDDPSLFGRLLKSIAEFCIRFTPTVALDCPDGILLEASGCCHLWGGEKAYLEDIEKRFKLRGYTVRAAIADTPATARAVARYAKGSLIVPAGSDLHALLHLPPEALRLEEETIARLHKLGLHEIHQFISMPRTSLRRRFGSHLIRQLDLALGLEDEKLNPVLPIEIYQERLTCLDPIVTAPGIAMALEKLLNALCLRLQQDQKGLRIALFKGFRIDGKVVAVEIATSKPSHHVSHLFKLFELKISSIEPGLGIELFILEAPRVEDHTPTQERLWEGFASALKDTELAELIDRLSGRIGEHSVNRYLPAEHYWPERSFTRACSLEEEAISGWRTDKLRPIRLLPKPERIEVTAPIPDYPPMLFRHKGKLHKVVHADGPERIEQEWWLQRGQHRDYYRVEDEGGFRYWLFRLGHYDDETYQWFLHGYFA